MAERLDFTFNTTPYNSMMAAEHISRYVVAAGFCKGKRVLDIACGEGYGAAFMSDHGAASVLGVDISESAISSAEHNFARSNVSYICADATAIKNWNPLGEKFDVIACFETIEHVPLPSALLEIFRDCLSPGGTILISCPNDLIEHERGIENPFHTGIYSFEDFRSMTTEILGEPLQWVFGSPITGIAVYDAASDIVGATDDSIRHMLNVRKSNSAVVLPAQSAHRVESEGATFYLGIWNGHIDSTIVAAPMSRRSHLEYYFSTTDLKKDIASLSKEISQAKRMMLILEKRLDAARRIYAFELERINERTTLILIENEKLEKQLLERNACINSYSLSRAHRIANLYTRTAVGSNLISRTFSFFMAASSSALRAVKRRLHKRS